MATIYSLVCWGGLTGKSVSGATATDILTLTNHGLRVGTKVVAQSTVSGVVAGTTYYAYPITASTFYLYDTLANAQAGGTTGRIDITATTAFVLKSYIVANPATALSAYGLSDLSRWGTSGSERIYDGIVSFNLASTGATNYDSEVVEIAESFIERYTSAAVTINRQAASCLIHTKINGIRTAGYHNGQVGTIGTGVGYQFVGQSGGVGFVLSGYRTAFDGFTYNAPASSSGGIALSKPLCAVRNMIVTSPSVGTSYYGIFLNAALTYAINNVVIGYFYGLYWGSGFNGCLFANNIAIGNGTGVKPSGTTGQPGYLYNNISIGNTTNWAALPTGIEGASNNAGASGDSPYAVGTGATTITMATTDFVNYASYDLRPASASSPQVDTGIAYYESYGYDIKDSERPNYNNGGAEAYDVGAFEYDHGYGSHPASTTVTFDGVAANSEIRVYNSTGSELAGIESCAANQALTWAIPSPAAVRIVIIHPDYRIKEFNYTSISGNQFIPSGQEPDKWYSNPA